jgi:hypothetical protein
MNALVRKEVRLLLPIWAASLIIVLLPAVLSPFYGGPSQTLLLGAGGVLA